MKIIKPKKLTKGDLIGILSPASSPDDLTRIDKSVKYFEKLGYNVEVAPNVGKYRGYLAGTDDERLSDLHYLFSKKDVKAIFAVRGGYGAGRLLDRIDYKLIKKNPKIFVGYSDITALQMSFLKKCGLVTFAGPMAAVDFWNTVDPYTEEIFWRIVTSPKKIGKVSQPGNYNLESLVKGSAKGKVVGGNLALIVSLLGTEFLPEMKNSILMIEDIGEAPYRVDRMLNQLKLSKVFEKINGIVLGKYEDCEETDISKKTLTLDEVFNDYLSKLKIPVIKNFQHGHIKSNITVPFGIDIKMNSKKGFVEYLEGAVDN